MGRLPVVICPDDDDDGAGNVWNDFFFPVFFIMKVFHLSEREDVINLKSYSGAIFLCQPVTTPFWPLNNLF